MSGRDGGPPSLPMKGPSHPGLLPPVHEPPYARGLGPMPPHSALLDELRDNQFGLGPRGLPPHPAISDEHSLRVEKDVQMKEMYDKSVQLEVDLHGVEAMRAELVKVNADMKLLNAVRQDLTGQVQVMTQDLARFTGELQQAPVLMAKIENVKQELHHARAAIEYEKKGYAENYEHGQVMEKKLISMARELEKLRAEIANAGKRSHAAGGSGGNPVVAGYNANYGNPRAGYTGNTYPVTYGINPGGMDGYPQYGPGAGAWGAYDTQRAQGHR
ncbi:hypothetical protein V6N11_004620 [Hibiscus sabdariffa]|uniref:Protein FLX-like 1 n=1 Tax=Hibiscus sabdariffa TaxID=183260 RepID=A0ABR2SHL2_9ROSI